MVGLVSWLHLHVILFCWCKSLMKECVNSSYHANCNITVFREQVHNELVRLDEQELNNKYKIGVLYCKKGQTTEEEIYNNGGYKCK